MAGRPKKSTKKFAKNHLKDTIDKRKEFAKIKQRQQVKAKKKARNASENAKASDLGGESPVPKQRDDTSGKEDPFAKMSVDEFFQQGFQLPEKENIKSRKSGVGERQGLGKRKRETSQREQDEESQSSEDTDGKELLDESEADAASVEDMELETHKGDLNALAEKDPEFYEYLKENDAELLDFANNADLAEVDQLSDTSETPGKERNNDAEGNEGSGDEGADGRVSIKVTMDLVNKWKSAMSDQHSLRALRQVVLAFRAAAYITAESGKEHKYSIPSPDVYHQLLVVALEHIPTVLAHHLPAKESSSGKVRIATDSKKYRTLTILLKSHAAAVGHLLENLSDAPTINLTVSSLMPLLPYMLSFKKILKNFIKTIVNIWSEPSSNEVTRINAFLVIRRLAIISDASIRETVLKTAYQGLVRGSRITNTHTLPGINLMKNSAAELWGLDPVIGYTTGFTYIRQLAIHLRTSTTQPGKDSYKTIYNWQYAHSLDFWSRVLAAHCSTQTNPHLKNPQASPLHPLIYPLVQIINAAVRLVPTPIFFPLRFHLTRALVRLSLATNTYIPLTPSLLDVLNSSELSKPPKPSTLKPLDFNTALRAPKAYLRTRVYQDGLASELSFLLVEFFACWSKHIAFPELAMPPMAMMKRWLKSATSTTSKLSRSTSLNPTGAPSMIKGKGPRNSKLTGQIVLVLQKMELNARWIEERRSQITFTPSQREEVDAFLRDVPVEDTPLGAFLVGMRAQREEKERLLEEARKSGRGEDAMSGATEGARREGKKGRGKQNERRGGRRVAHARDMEVDDEGMDESE
jgi:nucleolar complex protein 2